MPLSTYSQWQAKNTVLIHISVQEGFALKVKISKWIIKPLLENFPAPKISQHESTSPDLANLEGNNSKCEVNAFSGYSSKRKSHSDSVNLCRVLERKRACRGFEPWKTTRLSMGL